MLLPTVALVYTLFVWSPAFTSLVMQPLSVAVVHAAPVYPLAQIQRQELDTK